MSTDPTGYFDTLAADYAAYRPGYPDAAIAWVLEGLPEPVTAADIGCGTGISTRTLASRGMAVTGIDPSEKMLSTARSANDAIGEPVTFQLGTGHETGLPDSSMDLIVCAQSFHWLDPPVALSEFRRVLRPAGRVALMWNRRDGDVSAFDAILEDITNRSQDDAAARGKKVVRHRAFAFESFGDLFTDVETRTFDNSQQLTFEQLLGRFHSASYFPPDGSDLRAKLEREMREAFDAHQHTGTVALAQVTSVTRATCTK